MKIAVFMDPIHLLKPHKDSSVAMLKSAQEMGWECYFFTQNDLYCRDGRAFAVINSIQIGDVCSTNWALTETLGERELADFDIILIRKDPPFTMEYIYAMQILDLAQKAGVLVANNPNSICDLGEKTYTLHYPDLCPKTLVSSNISRLREFWDEHKSVIFKPLDGMGGQGIFHVNEDGSNLSVVLELLTNKENTTIMAQKYIPEIKTHGDKRVLLVNGEPIPYALARMPAKGELRGNLCAGGTGHVVPITSRDREICDQLSSDLKARGLYFVGIDIIGDYLTEINVTSPTCINEIGSETGLDIARSYMLVLEELRSR
ncbi:MAG: glutathione synthase [Legionellaceae bacterium]|nr:glutathione synthase [Legionellaceae bacterium]